MTEQTKIKTGTRRSRRMARAPKAAINGVQESAGISQPSGLAAPAEPLVLADKPQTKTDLIFGLLRREEGATLEQLVAATGWLPHTTRAALTGVKRKGHALSSDKSDGVRTYRIAPAGGAA